jgi:hypothetical protein
MPPYRGNRNRRIQNPKFAEDKILQMLVAGEGGFSDPTIRREMGGLPTVDELEEIASFMRLGPDDLPDKSVATGDLYQDMTDRNFRRAMSSGKKGSPERALSLLEMNAAHMRGIIRNPMASAEHKARAHKFLYAEPDIRKKYLKALGKSRRLAPLLLLAALVGGAGLTGGSENG